MTRITLDHDHHGTVRKSNPEVRFGPSHEASVSHERAQELVAAHDDVSFALPIPKEYDELRRIAAALPTDRVNGNDNADQIAAFLEQFSAEEIATLQADPSRLEVETENRREIYSVAEPEPDDSEEEPEDSDSDDEEE